MSKFEVHVARLISARRRAQNSKQKVKKSKQKEGKVSNQINNYRDFKHNQVKDRMKKALTIVAKTLKNITI